MTHAKNLNMQREEGGSCIGNRKNRPTTKGTGKHPRHDPIHTKRGTNAYPKTAILSQPFRKRHRRLPITPNRGSRAVKGGGHNILKLRLPRVQIPQTSARVKVTKWIKNMEFRSYKTVNFGNI